MTQITIVILCSGSGTRLWTMSRIGFSNQFLCVTVNESLFQQAAQSLFSLLRAVWAGWLQPLQASKTQQTNTSLS
jgi:mannose-1-phosphate guanylyltransferase